MKKFLFVLNKASDGIWVQEVLDQILSVAAFDQSVTLLFVDDGVFRMKKNRQQDAVGLQATGALFEVLDVYDVTELYAEAESLAQRGLSVQDLCLPVNLINRSRIAAFIKEHDLILPG